VVVLEEKAVQFLRVQGMLEQLDESKGDHGPGAHMMGQIGQHCFPVPRLLQGNGVRKGNDRGIGRFVFRDSARYDSKTVFLNF
jgi:hypothetical protein